MVIYNRGPPFDTLEIKIGDQLTSIFFQWIKGLHYLLLHGILYPLLLSFQCHPNLQQLELSLETTESVIELFSIFQSNTVKV